MKISIVQPDLAWEDKPRNLKYLEELISPVLNNTDIVVLPEMFNTGFSMNTVKLGEPPSGETFEWMMVTSQKGNFGLCGSYIVEQDAHFFNRWVFISPEKESWHYDKRHLFSMAGEDKFFSSGNFRLIFSFRGIRISPFICYDLRFPVWSRNRDEYDLMINAANWPERRREVWSTLLKARAIENQCFVAGSNRIGIDGNGISYCGDSMIIDPWGRIIATVNTYEAGSKTGEISMTTLCQFRKKFPVNRDADDFIINL
jgi:omega-amidase